MSEIQVNTDDELILRQRILKKATEKSLEDLELNFRAELQGVLDIHAAADKVVGGSTFITDMKACGYERTHAGRLLRVGQIYLIKDAQRGASLILSSYSIQVLIAASYLDDPFDIPLDATVRQIKIITNQQKLIGSNPEPETDSYNPFGNKDWSKMTPEDIANGVEPPIRTKPDPIILTTESIREFEEQQAQEYVKEEILEQSNITEQQAYAMIGIDILGLNSLQIKRLITQKSLTKLFNSYTKELHTDTGGNNDDMVLLNAGRELLIHRKG